MVKLMLKLCRPQRIWGLSSTLTRTHIQELRRRILLSLSHSSFAQKIPLSTHSEQLAEGKLLILVTILEYLAVKSELSVAVSFLPVFCF